ncbi:hypothetical protein AAF712_004547 [Marasmius tenuissimus]|uniref:Uncharacterized protein n=1 Tax=Marasmius tenuissimus TaxID=585030 RepID=A0ABR3A649_9AGAR
MSASAQTANQERGVSISIKEAEIRLINDLMRDLPEEERKNCLRAFNRHKKNCLEELTTIMKRERKDAPPPDSVNPEARHTTTEVRESTLEQGSSPNLINTSRQTGPCDLKNLNSPGTPPPCRTQRPDSRKTRYVHRFDPYTQRSERGRAAPMNTMPIRGAAREAHTTSAQAIGQGQMSNQDTQPARTGQIKHTARQTNPNPTAMPQPQPARHASVHQPPPTNLVSEAQRPATVFVQQHRPDPGAFMPGQQYPGQQGTTATHQRQVPVMPQPAPPQNYTHQSMRQPQIPTSNVRPLPQQLANFTPPPAPLTGMPSRLQPEVQARLMAQPLAPMYPAYSQQNVYQKVVVMSQIQSLQSGAVAWVNPYNSMEEGTNATSDWYRMSRYY